MRPAMPEKDSTAKGDRIFPFFFTQSAEESKKRKNGFDIACFMNILFDVKRFT